MEKWDSVNSIEETGSSKKSTAEKPRRSSDTANKASVQDSSRKISLPILAMPSRPSVGLNLNLTGIEEEGEHGEHGDELDKGNKSVEVEDQDGKRQRRLTGKLLALDIFINESQSYV